MESMNRIKSKNVCIVGSTTIDYIIQNEQKTIQLGGVTTYAGVTFQKHGLNPIIISNIARGDKSIFDFFHRRGITLHTEKTEKMTTFINRYDGDQRMQELPACAAPITTTHAMKYMNQTDHIHLGPLHPEDIDPNLYLSIPKGKIVSCDLQGLVRSVTKDKILLQSSPYVENALTCSDIIKVDERELQTILNSLSISLLHLQRQYDVKEIVITKGKKGGTILSESGKEMNYDPSPANQIGDTTGAGDVFFAAYLVARLYQKQNITESSRYASSIAAKQISGNYILPERLQSINRSNHQTNG